MQRHFMVRAVMVVQLRNIAIFLRRASGAHILLTLKIKKKMRVIIEPSDSVEKRMLAKALNANGLAVVELESEVSTRVSIEVQFKHALIALKEEGLIKHRYDYAWLYTLIEQDMVGGLPKFVSVKSFISFVTGLGIEGVASNSTLAQYYSYVDGKFPDWTFSDVKCDIREKMRRINLIKRFLILFRGK